MNDAKTGPELLVHPGAKRSEADIAADLKARAAEASRALCAVLDEAASQGFLVQWDGIGPKPPYYRHELLNVRIVKVYYARGAHDIARAMPEKESSPQIARPSDIKSIPTGFFWFVERSIGISEEEGEAWCTGRLSDRRGASIRKKVNRAAFALMRAEVRSDDPCPCCNSPRIQ